MLKQKKFPKVLYQATDISMKVLSFGRDTAAAPVATGEYIYFGLYKPFNEVYVELGTANATAAVMTVQYWNGTSYTAVSRKLDDTNGFTRSGAISFDKPTDWAINTVGSEDNYNLRISFDVNLDAGTTIQGMNIVFSDDQDLKGIYPHVSGYLASPETTFILRHENSRDLIVQDLRNRGRQKVSSDSLKYENLDAWDLLDVNEVRVWSAYLTMANIFSSLQSQEGDLYSEKATEYRKLAEFYKAEAYLSLDLDDDGLMDNAESAQNISTRRLVRG